MSRDDPQQRFCGPGRSAAAGLFPLLQRSGGDVQRRSELRLGLLGDSPKSAVRIAPRLQLFFMQLAVVRVDWTAFREG
jgi:hypothetical protein